MAVATTTMPEFLLAAQAAFQERFGDKIEVLLPDGYDQKAEQGYTGSRIMLSVEFSAADPNEQKGAFDTPTSTNLRVQVYTATGFADYDAQPDAYLAGLALVGDIIGWCGGRRFVQGQHGLEFTDMEAGDYDVKSGFQIPWVIDFAAPLRLAHDRTPNAPADPIARYGEYAGPFPPNEVHGKVSDPERVGVEPFELFYPDV